ncbi:MAG: methyltransferase domain-containing protein [Acidobacteriota bacterium]|nr:methyltransferase domain-containing protein [Acidobacteriota bacterium]
MSSRNPWDRYAAIEPLFAVLAKPKYLRANLTDEAEAEFFATGSAYARHVIDTARQRFSRVFLPKLVLEFGCGPGRVALAFSELVPAVVAVDSSPGMLAAARENARRFHRENIAFRSTDELFATRERFDLINVSFVLQHLAPDDGLRLVQKLLERLAPRGVAAFAVPFRRSGSALKSLVRWTRSHVAPLNALANVALRKPAGFPFLDPHVYDLSAFLAMLHDAGFDNAFVLAEDQGDTDVATVFVQRAETNLAVDEPPDRVPEITSDFIDVKELIATTSMDALHRKAEEYFAGLTKWEHHLAKPFANAADAPAILSNLAVMIEGLRLHPGATVLEFGGGTGWLSHALTQLGCRVILTDVAPSALEIARELYRRQPPIGNKPEPAFLQFDGHRIDLPDESVDRIVTFDAFHHVVNPEEVLRELARVLRPGGIAAFAEPGPNHSKTPQSQFEMRTYGVVENDVDIDAIWSIAQSAGFSDIRLAVFTPHPMFLGIAEYDDMLMRGEMYARMAAFTRAGLTAVRDFFLFKGGEEPLDSRRADALAARISVAVEGRTLRATLENIGAAKWLPASEELGGVYLGCHLYASDGTLLDLDFHRTPLEHEVASGASVTIVDELPAFAPGAYELEFDLVAAEVIWFAQAGSQTARVKVASGE